MYDGIRAMGWYSRADYARYRAEERANEYLQTQADQEGAARAQSPGAAGSGRPDPAEALASVAEVLSGIATIHITSLEAASTRRRREPSRARRGGRHPAPVASGCARR